MRQQTEDARQIAEAVRDASSATRRAHHQADDLAIWMEKLGAPAGALPEDVNAFAHDLRRA